MQAPNKPERFDITGVVVRARPEMAAEVAGRLGDMPGVEVHAIGGEGHLVVTIEESGGERLTIDSLSAMADLPGVLATSLIYHHAENEAYFQESTDEAD